MDWFSNIFTTYGPRVVGAAAGMAASKIAEKTGVTVDPAALVGIALAAYAAVHKGVSAKVNPGDAATGRMAEAERNAAATGSTVKVAPKE